MTPENFTYWLQGFAELSTEAPTVEQWQSICDHLALVLTKKTPPLTLGAITPMPSPNTLNWPVGFLGQPIIPAATC